MAGASGTGRTLFTLSSSFSSRLSRHTKRFLFPTLSNPITLFPRFRPLSSITTFPETIDSENAKHSMLLERLRIRHLKDSGKVTETKSLQKKGVVDESEIGKKKKVVNFGSFEELGLSDEVMGAVREMGIQIPTEIQCIGVPAVLDEKSVVLGSHTGSGKTLAYLLPLVQMLRRDEELNGILLKPKRPRAVVLCPTRELSEQVFRVAKSISHHARFRCTMVSGGGRLKPQEDSLGNPVDMVVGTPGMILQHIEEGNIVYGDIKYLVLDEADTMFDRGFGPDIHKFLAPLKHRASKPGSLGFQTILVTATMTTAVQKMVDEEFQGIEHLRTSTLHKKISSARHDFIRLPGSENKMDSLLQVLEPRLAKGNRVMVFCNTLHSSRAVDHFLGGNQTTFFYSTTSKSQRDLMLLQKFKERKLKGSSKDLKGIPKISSLGFDSDDHSKGLKNESVKEQEQEEKGDNVVVGGFKELGLSEEVVEVMDEIGEFVPSEIQCVVIPTVLEGKCVLLSSPSTPDRTLAYLLPIIQLLRRDKELLGSNSKHPRALVLCASEEKAEQCFNAAAHIIRNAELKSAKNRASSDIEKSNSSIGLMIGTPSEILQYIEEGVVVPAELNYLVLDEADFLLDSNLGDEIHKIIRSLRHDESKSTVKKLQTILAISTIAEVLGEKSPLVQRLERDHAGIVSAMSLEMEQTEVFHFIESLDALKKKLAEAMTSL